MKNKYCRAYREFQDCLARCYHLLNQPQECRRISLSLVDKNHILNFIYVSINKISFYCSSLKAAQIMIRQLT